MLTKEQIDALKRQKFDPYTHEEYASFIANPEGRLRAHIERVHYHNQDLCLLVDHWSDYAKGLAPKPDTSLTLALIPGHGGANDALDTLGFITEFYAKRPHGSVKTWPCLIFMSKTCITLLQRLRAFHATPYLASAEHHIKDFINLITYEGEPIMRQDEFAAKLHAAKDDFFSACEHNAMDLSQWLDAPERKEKPPAPHRQRTSYTISIKNAASLVGTSPKTFQRRLNGNPDLVRLMREPVLKVCMAAVKDWWTAYETNIAIARREVRAMNRPLHLE